MDILIQILTKKQKALSPESYEWKFLYIFVDKVKEIMGVSNVTRAFLNRDKKGIALNANVQERLSELMTMYALPNNQALLAREFIICSRSGTMLHHAMEIKDFLAAILTLNDAPYVLFCKKFSGETPLSLFLKYIKEVDAEWLHNNSAFRLLAFMVENFLSYVKDNEAIYSVSDIARKILQLIISETSQVLEDVVSGSLGQEKQDRLLRAEHWDNIHHLRFLVSVAILTKNDSPLLTYTVRKQRYCKDLPFYRHLQEIQELAIREPVIAVVYDEFSRLNSQKKRRFFSPENKYQKQWYSMLARVFQFVEKNRNNLVVSVDFMSRLLAFTLLAQKCFSVLQEASLFKLNNHVIILTLIEQKLAVLCGKCLFISAAELGLCIDEIDMLYGRLSILDEHHQLCCSLDLNLSTNKEIIDASDRLLNLLVLFGDMEHQDKLFVSIKDALADFKEIVDAEVNAKTVRSLQCVWQQRTGSGEPKGAPCIVAHPKQEPIPDPRSFDL